MRILELGVFIDREIEAYERLFKKLPNCIILSKKENKEIADGLAGIKTPDDYLITSYSGIQVITTDKLGIVKVY